MTQYDNIKKKYSLATPQKLITVSYTKYAMSGHIILCLL